MRRAKILIGACAAIIMAAGSTASAQEQHKAPGAKATGVKPVGPLPTKGVPLSVNECLGLGGDVHTDTSVCGGTGKYCTTTTVSKAGVKHVNVQCITTE